MCLDSELGVQNAGACVYGTGVCLSECRECVGADGYVSACVNYRPTTC